MDIRLVKQGIHDQNGIWLFTLVKNEEYFIPHFLDHYRALGVSNFVIYDDKSTDSSRQILEQQNDCTIITSDFSFGQKLIVGDYLVPFNDILKNSIHELFYPDKWGIYVDCDEFLVLPENEVDLHSLINNLEKNNQYHSFGPMVDFYPKTLEARNYNSSFSPFEGCPYFDKGPVFSWDRKNSRASTISGIRLRLKQMLMAEFPEELSKINNGVVFNGSSVKTPLIKHGMGILRKGAHYTNIEPSLKHQVALAHFKFYPSLDSKLKEALFRKQYYGGSVEYMFINLMLEKLEHRSLLNENTVFFEGPSSFSMSGIW